MKSKAGKGSNHRVSQWTELKDLTRCRFHKGDALHSKSFTSSILTTYKKVRKNQC